MPVDEIKPGIFFVGAKDYDRRLFDELIPLPDGTTYNAYLVIGSKKTALIDSVDGTKFYELEENLRELKIKKIDYLVSNHTEQDHSESIVQLAEMYPDAKVVSSTKGKRMLQRHLHIPEDRFIEKNNGETLSLGDKTLEFIEAPFVHWPETMFTLAKEDKVLFPCDFFGSHLAISTLTCEDEGHLYEASKRYYAEIMMPFKRFVNKHLKTLENYDFEIIAPSHGPVHFNPEFIINAYKEWAADEVKNEVVIPYVSMHHSVKLMVEHLVKALHSKGIRAIPMNLTVTDLGELAKTLVDAATVVIGTPAVLNGAHPAAAYAAYLANALRPKTRYASLIGSFGWGCKMQEQLLSLMPRLTAEVIEPVIVKGKPTEEAFRQLDELADKIYQKHQNDKLVIKNN